MAGARCYNRCQNGTGWRRPDALPTIRPPESHGTDSPSQLLPIFHQFVSLFFAISEQTFGQSAARFFANSVKTFLKFGGMASSFCDHFIRETCDFGKVFFANFSQNSSRFFAKWWPTFTKFSANFFQKFFDSMAPFGNPHRANPENRCCPRRCNVAKASGRLGVGCLASVITVWPRP